MATAVVAGAVLVSNSANASGVNLATGLDGLGNLQPSGDLLDANWKITGATYPLSPPNAFTVAPNNADWYGGWPGNGPNSSWIAGNPDVTNNGKMTFTRTFFVSDPSTASIVGGAWTIDDAGTLSLNGNNLGSLGNGNWGTLWAFSTVTSDFVSGVNTLTIQMGYTDYYLEGARLEGTLVGGTATPLPSTWLMLLSGFVGLGFFAYRGTKKRTAIAAA